MKNNEVEQIYKIDTPNKPLTINFYRYIGFSDKDVYFPERQYSKRDYNRAGQLLINESVLDTDKDEAYKKVSEWRALHQIPLNIVYQTLKQNVAQIDLLGTIAQRSKRLPSIKRKLGVMKGDLTTIQDIGGCRAIVGSMEEVNKLLRVYEAEKGYKLRDNYINKPKADGYRSVHLIYTHQEPNSPYDGLKIELQIRTLMQHAWATALETVDVFTKQALKFGGGDADWKRFFALMASYFAHKEKSPVVENTPEKYADLLAEISDYEARLRVTKTLNEYSQVIVVPNEHVESAYLVVEQYPHQPFVDIAIYPKHQYQAAVDRYILNERRMAHANINIVLVSVETIKALLEAYPNYFGDTKLFLAYLDTVKRTHMLNSRKIN